MGNNIQIPSFGKNREAAAETVATPELQAGEGVVDTVVEPENKVVEEPQKPEQKEVIAETKGLEENTDNYDEVVFDMGEAKGGEIQGESAEAQKEEKQPFSIKNFVGGLNEEQRKELMEEMGIDEFAAKMSGYVKKGGKREDYLNAKAIDWASVGDEDLIKADMRKQYKNFSKEDIQELFDDEFKQGEYSDDTEKRIGALRMKAKGEMLRQRKIEESEALAIPPEAQPKVDNRQMDAFNEMVARIKNNDITRALLQDKRVVVNTGDGVMNIQVPNPQLLVDVMTNPAVNAKYGTNEKGEPDIQLMMEAALLKINAPAYRKAILDRGMYLQRQKDIAAKQNINGRSNHVTPTNTKNTGGNVWKNATLVRNN